MVAAGHEPASVLAACEPAPVLVAFAAELVTAAAALIVEEL